MKRIPEVFAPVDGDPDLGWVLAGDYIAFRQRDGVGVLVKDGKPYVRHSGPSFGITIAPDWILCSDPDDPIIRCWVPLPTSDMIPEAYRDAPSQYSDVRRALDRYRDTLVDGEYEVTGPCCGLGNEREPVAMRMHIGEILELEGPQTRESLHAFLVEHPMRGIVFRHSSIVEHSVIGRVLIRRREEITDAHRIASVFLDKIAKVTSRSLGIPWPPGSVIVGDDEPPPHRSQR